MRVLIFLSLCIIFIFLELAHLNIIILSMFTVCFDYSGTCMDMWQNMTLKHFPSYHLPADTLSNCVHSHSPAQL